MLGSCDPPPKIIKKAKLTAYAAMALFAALFVSATAARADDTYSELTTMAVSKNTDSVNCPGGSTTLGHFDISWVDSLLNFYLLSDRTNCSLDVFDVNTNKELFFVGGFAGQQGTNNDISGPDGVLTVNGRYAFVGDGPDPTTHITSVKVVDLFAQSIVASVAIPVPAGVVANRADEMAYDPKDNLIMVANDAPSTTAATPAPVAPFVTFISTTPGYGILGQLSFPNACNTAINPTTCNGLEQSAYSSKTKLFYISVPVVGSGPDGEIAVINPRAKKFVGHFPLTGCQPAGLAIGPNLEAMVGCSNGPVQIVSLVTGATLATFSTLGFADEAWFNKGSGQYFVAQTGVTSTKGKKTVIVKPAQLGVVNADLHTLDQLIPTTIGDHSVAVDANLNHVFLPDTGTPAAGAAGCGCVKVFNVTGEDVAAK